MMACVNSLAMMEGLVLGRRAGLDPMTIYEVVKASSGGSKALERIPTAIVPRNFAPGFKVFLMNKDLETFNTIAKELHVPVSFSNVAQRYQQAAMRRASPNRTPAWRSRSSRSSPRWSEDGDGRPLVTCPSASGGRRRGR